MEKKNKREIKFRVWNLDREEWVEYGNLDMDGNFIQEGVEYHEYHYAIQLFTGLLDKNGKEIYCGDIVKGYFDTNEVEDYIWLSLTDEEKKNGWKLFKIDMDIVEFARQQLPEELEIVGNVMENPNLLSEKEK